MTQNQNHKYSQPEEFRAGRISSEALLKPFKKVLRMFIFISLLLVSSGIFLERYGMPGLRWRYEFTYIGSAKHITQATYLTPVGLIESYDQDEFQFIDVLPTPQKYKPSNFTRTWLRLEAE